MILDILKGVEDVDKAKKKKGRGRFKREGCGSLNRSTG
jgi:hypothetical protein